MLKSEEKVIFFRMNVLGFGKKIYAVDEDTDTSYLKKKMKTIRFCNQKLW